MDPLSAIQMMTGPQMSGSLDAATKAAPLSIPSADLQQLNSDTAAQSATATQGSGSFSNLLGDFVGEVNNKQNAATDSIAGLLGGKNVSLHQTMISMEEASVSFQMMVEVRNKLLDSYQELMRMQI